MHHIVSDGWSRGIFWNELSALYAAFLSSETDPLPEPEIQYADYAVWQRQWIEGEILQQQAEYWKTALTGAPALLKLPRLMGQTLGFISFGRVARAVAKREGMHRKPGVDCALACTSSGALQFSPRRALTMT